MPIWNNSESETFYASGASEAEVCIVRIDDGQIVVDYGAGGWLYEGQEREPGHYDLRARHGDGKATLHRFSNDDTLIGDWVANGVYGMWRVTLG